MRPLAVLLLVSLLLLPAGALAGEAAAVLVSASGPVVVVRGGSEIAASFGTSLETGDVVRAGKDGRASILYASGAMVEVGSGGEATVKVDDGGGPLLATAAGSAGELADFAQVAASDEGLAALPTLRSGGVEEGAPLHPRGTVVADTQPTFTWTEVPDALEYTVILQGEGEAAGRHGAAGPAWSPESGLEPGGEWTWQVEALTEDGPVTSNPVNFSVADTETVEKYAALHAELAPMLESGDPGKADAAAWMLAGWCGNRHLYGDAIVALEGLTARHPERKELFLQLGSLYQATGRTAEAVAAYRRAAHD